MTMLRSINDIKGYSLKSGGEALGTVSDFNFDDHEWTIRHVVIDTGGWLTGRKVLIPPAEIKKTDWENQDLVVELNKDEVEKSPPLSADEPVSRQYEDRLYSYYGWHPYWVSGIMSGAYTTAVNPSDEEDVRSADEDESQEKPIVRSCKEVIKYRLEGIDGEIGDVEDFIADDQTWQILYLVVSTGRILPGKKVLLAKMWVDRVSWSESKIYVDLTGKKIKESPEFDRSIPVDRDYEERLFEFYGRKGYWL
ncbi:MAG TPA: PRC-barrel domain containing protein [candidate division Zixibacteria bacterium]|nr:PRC-barrel domain containing protein [candidate division Zixibacteria bacterium]